MYAHIYTHTKKKSYNWGNPPSPMLLLCVQLAPYFFLLLPVFLQTCNFHAFPFLQDLSLGGSLGFELDIVLLTHKSHKPCRISL